MITSLFYYIRANLNRLLPSINIFLTYEHEYKQATDTHFYCALFLSEYRFDPNSSGHDF